MLMSWKLFQVPLMPAGLDANQYSIFWNFQYFDICILPQGVLQIDNYLNYKLSEILYLTYH